MLNRIPYNIGPIYIIYVYIIHVVHLRFMRFGAASYQSVIICMHTQFLQAPNKIHEITEYERRKDNYHTRAINYFCVVYVPVAVPARARVSLFEFDNHNPDCINNTFEPERLKPYALGTKRARRVSDSINAKPFSCTYTIECITYFVRLHPPRLRLDLQISRRPMRLLREARIYRQYIRGNGR